MNEHPEDRIVAAVIGNLASLDFVDDDMTMKKPKKFMLRYDTIFREGGPMKILEI